MAPRPFLENPMRTLLFSFAMLAILAVGCGETAVKDSAVAYDVAEVDAAGLESAISNNSITLVDFTAVW
jgi:hypothetical protein